jgi:peptide/nickel transport system substrate-binding protein
MTAMSRTIRARVARSLAALGLVAALLVPAAGPAAAQEKVVLRIGATQPIEAVNPYQSVLVADYEGFQLTYNLLVDFGPDLGPAAAFAEAWEPSADGTFWTFTIRDGMRWSDGEPATSADACFSWQLILDALAAESYIGSGYLDPGLSDAGVTRVECPDATTMIAYTDDRSDRILQSYVPIIPQHVWGEETWETIGEADFGGPLVGTGPYTLVSWDIATSATFTRNENYWGSQGFADEVIIQWFDSADTMVQALRQGELDYARGVNPDQLKALDGQPGFATVAGKANGWTQLAFNSYGTGTGNVIEDGGPSTQALLDPAFRDALGYAVDKDLLVERVLGGFGDVGTTVIPPVLAKWHVEPTTPRRFDLDEARRRLDAAGYDLDTQGQRLDKEGQPIKLRMVMPNTEATYANAAEFIVDWYGQLGIAVSRQVLSSGAVTEIIYPPEAGEGYNADYDIELWGWTGSPDPNGLLSVFRCDAIGSYSDSQWCSPEFDAMYDAETAAATDEERAGILAEMQNLVYDEAVYDVLFYDAELHAYRTDRFAGWQTIPAADGTPFFTYGTLNYTYLTDATAQASPSPGASAGASPGASPGASAGPSASPGGGDGGTGGGGDNTLLIVGAVAALAVVVGGLVLVSRRRSAGGGDEDE